MLAFRTEESFSVCTSLNNVIQILCSLHVSSTLIELRTSMNYAIEMVKSLIVITYRIVAPFQSGICKIKRNVLIG